MAQHIRERFIAPQATLRELFRRITFNVLVSIIDDHARNHAAFWNGELLKLTPADDICPQQRTGHTAEQAMYIGDERDNFKASVVTGCVERAGLYQLTARVTRPRSSTTRSTRSSMAGTRYVTAPN